MFFFGHSVQPYQNSLLFFTGRKLRSPGIGIEASVNSRIILWNVHETGRHRHKQKRAKYCDVFLLQYL